MNSGKQRIVIAETLGVAWQDVPPKERYLYRPKRILSFHKWEFDHPRCAPLPLPNPITGDATDVPDYPQDRNAMTEAIAKLPPHQHLTFGRNLHEILGLSLVGYVSNYPAEYKQIVTLLTAPVPLLAEAYLHTVGRWETLPPTTKP
jgi:hypothetical protein